MVLYCYVRDCLQLIKIFVGHPVRPDSSLVDYAGHAGKLGSLRYTRVGYHNPYECIIYL